VVFDEEEITEETLQNCVKDITYRIDELQKHYRRAQLAGRLPIIVAKQKAREYRRCRFSAARSFEFRSSSATSVSATWERRLRARAVKS